MDKGKKDTIEEMLKIAEKIYRDIERVKVPSLEIPSRTKSNIKFENKISPPH